MAPFYIHQMNRVNSRYDSASTVNIGICIIIIIIIMTWQKLELSADDDAGDIARLLATAEKSDTETINDFTGRVQRLIASSLQVAATSFTSSDKMNLIKQLHTHSRQSGRHCVIYQQHS